MAVVIETTLGDITVDLYPKERPNTCLNFLKLCKIKYYNYCLFHSVQRNFVVQTGDPTDSGRGGESVFRALYGDQAKYFDAEILPKIKHKHAGTLSMINNGNNQYGSQFLITTGENLDYLDGKHVVFGEVAEGFDVLMKINEAFCDDKHRPYQDIRITHTVILDDPFDDPDGLRVPDRSPELTEEQLKDPLRIAAHEKIDDYEGMTLEERKEIEEAKEADHKAQVLEMIGDLPDKDVAPPDHVLFVCKLNAVTTDEDLEIIFSRFGTIKSCEIIRDRKTGDSLQYAFVEFSTAEECEKAYLKMDNVLIDDRRIHVDFSQSVSKLQYPKNPPPKENKRERQDNQQNLRHDKNNDRKYRNDREKGTKSREGTNDREVRCGKHSKRDVDKYKRHKRYEESSNKPSKGNSRSPRRYSLSPSPKRTKKHEDSRSHKNTGKWNKKSEKMSKKYASDEEKRYKKSHSSNKKHKDKSHKKKRYSSDSSS